MTDMTTATTHYNPLALKNGDKMAGNYIIGANGKTRKFLKPLYYEHDRDAIHVWLPRFYDFNGFASATVVAKFEKKLHELGRECDIRMNDSYDKVLHELALEGGEAIIHSLSGTLVRLCLENFKNCRITFFEMLEEPTPSTSEISITVDNAYRNYRNACTTYGKRKQKFEKVLKWLIANHFSNYFAGKGYRTMIYTINDRNYIFDVLRSEIIFPGNEPWEVLTVKLDC